MKSRIIASLLFIQIFISTLFAQGSWSWVNPLPQGNLLNGVHFVNDNVGWAVGKMGYILKTTDGGQTWVNQNSTTTAQLNAVQFLNENVGFVVGDSGRILKTTNSGNTWIRLTSSYNYWISSLHFINENYGWLGAGNYILATTNGGANWTSYYQGAPYSIYGVYFLNQTTGFWVGFSGVYKTTDGGQKFNYLWDVPNNYDWNEIFFINSTIGWIVGDGGKVAKTTDGGTTWVEVGGVTSSGYGMFFKDENNGWIANYYGIYRTQNGGSSWTLTPIKNMMDVYFVQNAGYAVGAGGKIFKTTNLGDNWVPSYQNIAQDRRLAGIFFNDPSVGFAVGDSGKILKTDNDGSTWVPQTSPSNTNLTSVFFADVNTGWITGYNVILKTTNSGNSWRLKYTGNYENLNNLFFLNSQTGWVVGDNIRKTEDGGNTWTEQTLTDVYGEYYLKGVYFIDANKGFVVGPSGWLFKTTNGGSNWNKVVTPTSVNLSKIKFLDNMTGWIVGEQGTILKTTNGGINWDILNFGQNYSLLDFQIIDAQTLWAVGGTTYSDYGSFTLYTTDGGDTWKNIINPNSQCLYGTCFLDKNTGWAVGEQGAMINYSNNQAIPSAPGNLIASAISGKVNLSWIDNSFDETGFEIYRSDYYSGNYKKIATVNQNTTSYQDNNVNAPVTYWYRVRSVNSTGSSALCREDSANTILAVPSTPVLFSPANGSTKQSVSPTLRWNAASGASTYQCQVAIDIQFNNLIVNDSTLSSTSKLISGLANSTLYYWKVRAKNAGGKSPWSDVWSFSTLISVPASPTLVSPPNNSFDQPINLTLAWNASSRAQYYQVEVGKNWFTTIAFRDTAVYNISIQITGLENNTPYVWRVRSVNEGGYSNWSDVWDFQTILAPPPKPILLAPLNGAKNEGPFIFMNWEYSNALSYRLQISKDINFTSTVLDSVMPNSSTSIGPLEYGTTFFWHVNGTNSGGTGPWSDTWSFSTLDMIPIDPVLNNPSNGSINEPVNTILCWSKCLYATRYHLQISTNLSMVPIYFESDQLADTFYQCSLQNNMTYYWRVRSRNDTYNSSWTFTWNFTTQSASSVEKLDNIIPEQFSLKQNYPNPFNPTTFIEFDIAESNYTDLSIYDNLGRLVKVLFRGDMNAGRYRVILNAEDLTSGIYYCRIYSGKNLQSKKMLLIK